MGSQRVRYEWACIHHTPLESMPTLWCTSWGKPWTIWVFPLISFFYSAHWMAEWFSFQWDSKLPSISILLLSLSAGSWNHLKVHLFTSCRRLGRPGFLKTWWLGSRGQPTKRRVRQREKLRPRQAKASSNLALEDHTGQLYFGISLPC